jgi:pyruvate/2-oxoglutarate dehydrogenase complex dihydrolipoamide dehydrogenase (E3) component
LSETEAKEKDIEYDVVRQELAEVDRAVVESQETGFAKILLKRGTDKILGVTIVAEHAGELIHEFVLAMKHGIGLGKIASTIHVYPTFAEVARKAGDQYNKTRLTPSARKLFGWLYRRQRGGET